MPAKGTELGVDVDCQLDHGYVLGTCSGFRNLGNALIRRYTTPRGGLFYDPNYGLDLRRYLLAGLTRSKISELIQAVKAEALKDERVEDVELKVTRAAGVLRLELDVLTADGPFRLVLGVDQVSVTVLNDGLPPLDVSPVPPTVLPQPVYVIGQAGAPGPAGPAGAAGGGAGATSFALDEAGEFATTSASAEVLIEQEFQFDDLAPAALIQISFSADVSIAGGATGNFRLYVGGTTGAADGTLVATLSTVSATFERKTVTTLAFARPTGLQYVKVAGFSSVAGQSAAIRGTTITIKAV